MITTTPEIREEIYTVSRLNREARTLLEQAFPLLWVEGEISNFSAPNSGHWYFSLKDNQAQIRCAMFRSHNRKLTFTPQDGMHVLVRTRVSLYEGRGDFQLLVEDMEERGEGKLRKALEVLKKQLQAKGLFDPAHKKPIPTMPRCIGVVTSITGAAIRDILTVLKRRFPCVPVIIYPTLVQGNTAAPTIVNAINLANHRQDCDVLIVARGGGSLEDLWPFNEESVAYSIYQSTIPIISGIGHEIDFTIADFVADQRAATPSAAAELATPDKTELLTTLQQHQQRLTHLLKQKLTNFKQHILWAQKHLHQQHPKRQLAEKMQFLDFAVTTLKQWQLRLLIRLQSQTKTVVARWQGLRFIYMFTQYRQQLDGQQQQLQSHIQRILQQQHMAIAQLAAKLDTLSPLATLSRGYAIVTRSDNQHILRHAQEVVVGDNIQVKLMQGDLDCKVEKILIH
ncbi:MAG: exodeoxyribonuclease VII large subunit [Gammaproteobacteria bacterium RIFCSPHIGHO2_12_FULL_41_20]|nr:MAG: exodeoxyribonuclease VII large subunit [Gammaproteobacteria bacterium RIFCSPHIGHO2_12_FULL_41_20]